MAGWVLGRAIPVPTRPSQDPELVIFKVKRPTYGQMKAILVNSMRFS